MAEKSLIGIEASNLDVFGANSHSLHTMKSFWFKLNSIVETIATSLQSPFLLVVRLYWGWQFFQVGKGKLMDLPATAENFTSFGLPAPMVNAVLAGSTECFGGLLLLIGLGSRLAAIPLIGTMIVAYLTVHLDSIKTIWDDSDNFVTQAPFLFLLAAVIAFVFGPGKFSVDHFLIRKTGKIS